MALAKELACARCGGDRGQRAGNEGWNGVQSQGSRQEEKPAWVGGWVPGNTQEPS